jgi:exopolysaccharide biosynthesis predicted pyruvyltransferase EpsI
MNIFFSAILIILSAFGSHAASNRQLIEEAKAIIQQTISPLLRRDRPIVLVGVGDHSNKGDSLLAYATAQFLKDEGFGDDSILFIAGQLSKAETLAQLHETIRTRIRPSGGVIVFFPGGNFGTLYPSVQRIYTDVVANFSDVRIIQLPQSFVAESSWFRDRVAPIYRLHKDIHIVLRDSSSFARAKEMALSPFLYLCPDMAFFVGDQSWRNNRLAPRRPFLWLDRKDSEAVQSCPLLEETKSITENAVRRDWEVGTFRRPANRQSLSQWYLAWSGEVERGFHTVMQGSVVMSTRLHGQIFAILLGSPVIVLRDRTLKGQHYFESWSHKFDFVVAPNCTEVPAFAKLLSAVASFA